MLKVTGQPDIPVWQAPASIYEEKPNEKDKEIKNKQAIKVLNT
jgi:hypothetical protein